MNPVEIVRSALRGMAANALRSVLTLLGVLIGVGSVILLVGVGNGSAQAVAEQIGSLGTTTLTVRTSGGDSRGGEGAISSQALTADVADALASDDGTEHIDVVVPQVTSSGSVTFGSATLTAQLVGSTSGYFEATSSNIAQGVSFTANDEAEARRVVVIGAEVAETLFVDVDPVGQQMIIGSTPYVVNGVMAAKDSAGTTSTNDLVVMPLSRMEQSITGYGDLTSIVLTATSADDVETAQIEATLVLDAALGVQSGDDAPYTISNQSELLAAQDSTTETFAAMLAAVAGLSLVVGGIGVTNIMLVTVTERTREIGIRKALGATRGAILGQFLLEATLLSVLGGALGVLAAFVGSTVTIMGVEPVIVGSSVVLALAVSLGIGIVFGGYPAARAAMMRPVDALRHD
ncbi:ABC transporter permease [Sanguibacter antarcticus]|uniref:Putative ABC transport system permease protein n=1 Tax=Sanguibacter antarcticus TaxID=372484 RepID=A0A2A9EA48_9MICO|nr:ABC transporter permease [Sanguibacter antarcticus]PFG35145.1 putative ABC transport system permease protein [Sanguibacter antarcticus]